ncbi:winged helix-turn-helix domain-containing protein [Obesumbacterium proteus]|uniref:winged helix-turn-helix domain-containing protein n=1 Tax=Obesumbacterium proteus TaxID=82983 RepID=UPI00242EE065|nr:winged helix-turn-helix domain-containing protein [Obesumbacterium proteus]
MIYKINETVRFKPADGAIWSMESPEQVINLTITNCNLLCLLLNKKGEILSREQILEDIWDKQGLRSSNNTLNQYISILRRTFSLLGIDDEVIKTIPKVGFSLNSSISVEKECNAEPVKVNEKEKNQKLNPTSYIYTVVMSALAIFIAVFFTYVLYKNDTYSLDTHIANIGKFDACNVNVLPEYTRGQSRDLLESSVKLITVSEVRCIPERIFIVKPESRGSGRSFLAECIVDKRRNEYFFCKGYYIK